MANKIVRLSILVFCCVYFYFNNLAAGHFDQSRLENQLFANYNRKVRPVKRQSDVTDISFAVHVRHIEAVDDYQQTLTFHGILFLSWNDAYLNWNARDFNGTTSINLASWKIWQPDIALFNSATGSELVFNYWKYPVWVTNTGSVAEWQDFSFTITCKFDYYYFPNDKQKCTATLGSWMYDHTEVDWKWIEPWMVRVKLSWYGEKEKRHSNGWQLINATGTKAYWGPSGVQSTVPTEVSPKFVWPMMLIHLELQRHRPYFYVTEVLPLLMISLLTLASFWIETESVTLSILLVNLLAQSILSWGLLNQLPPSAGPLPKIVIIYGMSFGLASASLFLHILLSCLSKWKFQLPESVDKLTLRANQFKPFASKGVSFYNASPLDDQEHILDEVDDDLMTSTRSASSISSTAQKNAPGSERFPNLLFFIRRIVFFIYALIYLGMIIAILC